MSLIDNLKELCKSEKKKIILTEGSSEEVLLAAKYIIEEEIADLLILGDKEEAVSKYEILSKAEWINPKTSELIKEYITKLYELRQDRGMTLEEATNLILEDPMYFACMLVLDHKADGIVSGKTTTSKATLIPALKLIKGKERLVSSFFIIESPNKSLGNNGILIFADCALNQTPTSEELAIIGTQSISSYKEFIGDIPKVAYLSHSTYGSSEHKIVDKVRNATHLARELNEDVLIDGEMQLDAAIIPEVASIKCPESPIQGQANILIFPNIDSGNIGYKLVERFGDSKAYGPITQGLKCAVNDLSRGSSVEDIIGVIVITALQARKNVL